MRGHIELGDDADSSRVRISNQVAHFTLGVEQSVRTLGCELGKFPAFHPEALVFRKMPVKYVEFHCGLFYDAPLEDERFDLVTMWHFLEHDYDPLRSLETARRVLKPQGRLVIEVPRLDSRTFRWFGDRWPGLQAPQHTVLFDRDSLLRTVRRSGFEVVDYLPYGAFPAYFYLFTGAAFRMLKGRGLDLDRAIVPYFVGQLRAWPVMLFERRLNLAMQTVVCRRAS